METRKLIKSLTMVVVISIFGFSHAVAQGVLKLGTAQPVTGGANLYGLTTLQGLNLAIEDVNAKGGIGGRKIELISYDTTSKPPVATTLAQRLIYEDKVPLIFGSGSSLDNLAMMEVTEKESFPLFIPSAASPQITAKGYKWVWRLSLNDGITAQLLGRYISQKSQWKRIALFHENTEYGNPPTDVLAEMIKGLKDKAMVGRETFSRGDTDVTGQLMRIKSANPDVVVTWSVYTEGALIARQSKQVGLKAQLIGNQAIQLPEYVQLAGAAAEGVMCIESTSSQVNPDSKIQAFAKRYEEKFKRSIYNSSVDGYDGAMVITEVLKKVGTDRKKVQNALNTMTFQGIAEAVRFDSTGQATKGALIARVEGGRFKFLEYVQK